MQDYIHKTGLLVTLLIVFVFSANCLAETTGFKISDYIPEKFKDLEWRVDGAFRLKGKNNSSSIDEPRYNSSNEHHVRSTDRDNDEFVFALGSYLNYEYITLPHFLNVITSIDTDIRFNSTNSNETDYHPDIWNMKKTDQSSNTYNLRIKNDIDAGHYLFDDLFISANTYVYYSYSELLKDNRETFSEYKYYSEPYTSVKQSETDVDKRSDTRNISIVGELFTGWGRLYEGSYASTALYIIEELKRDGLLVKNPSQQNMLDLTEVIYQYRQKHAIDGRLHKIESLQKIFDFLENERLINETGSNDYLLIQDIWDYFPRVNRKFGSKVRLGVGLEYDYGSDHIANTSEIRRIDYRYHDDNPHIKDTLHNGSGSNYNYISGKYDFQGSYLVLNAEYHVPLNRQWQLLLATNNKYYLKAERDNENYSTSVDPNIINPNSHERKIKYDDYYQIEFVSDIDYIINSRTSLNILGIIAMYKRDFSEVLDRTVYDINYLYIQSKNEKGWSLDIKANMSYRISIPTSFNVRLSYSSNHNEYTFYYNGDYKIYDSDNGMYYLTLSIEHYLY